MKVFLTVLLLISLAGNVYLYMNPKEKIIIKQEMPQPEIKKIQEIATICGIDSETFEHASILSNLSDIKSALWNNTTKCEATPISQEEEGILDSYLNDQPVILSKIKAQNTFVEPYSMKRIIILSVKE